MNKGYAKSNSLIIMADSLLRMRSYVRITSKREELTLKYGMICCEVREGCWGRSEWNNAVDTQAKQGD
jgi:hypothetical protein